MVLIYINFGYHNEMSIKIYIKDKMAFYQKLEYISVFRNLWLLNKTTKNAKSIYVKTSYKRTKEYTFFL